MPPKRKSVNDDEEEGRQNNVQMETNGPLDVSEIREEEDVSEDEEGLKIEDIYIPPPPKPVCSSENTGPRLIITHIENENFKSYAGKQVLGPFHKCFTSIIGPNGSGKSNVIDSMLFVFGYRASKIRSKKISVLLHNSAQHQNIQSCTVAVHFQQIIDKSGGDDFEVVPNSKFVIARTAFKDNTSFYTVNKRRVQFKAVAKLLRGHGIDLDHNRFLILQGEVEQIAMMKPKAPSEHESGMLEFLEDIIGTTRYKEPLEKLMVRVEQLNEERSEKLNRVKIVEKEKDDLEGPMKEAVVYLKVENEMAQTRNVLCQRYIHENEVRREELEGKRQAIEDSSSGLRQELKEIGERREEKSKAIKDCTKSLEDLVNRKESLTEQFNKINQCHVGIKADMTQTNKKRKKTKELLVEEKKKLNELELVPERNEKEIVELTGRDKKLSADLEKEKAAMEKAMAGLRAETQELQDSKDQLQTQLIDLKKTVDETKSAYDIAKAELEIYVSSEQKERTKLEQIKKNYDTASSTVAGRKDEIEALKTGIPEAEKQLLDAQMELAKVKEEETAVSAELRAQRAQVEETRSSMQATRSRGRVLDSLMEQKRLGHLPGIFGRLGDLGAIDKKYDVAVSTACGPLDNIVVDTVNTGKQCIEFLKKNDIGRATFIALEKQEHLCEKFRIPISPPEGVPRLFDLIRVEDERVRPAFYFALRDTLVANELEQATRIAYGRQRYRVVTLDGQLIELSGTMTGGGREVLRGRMGQSVMVSSTGATPKKLDQMENKLKSLESRARQLHSQQVALEDRVALLTQQLQTMRMDLNKFNMEIKFSAEQLPTLKKQLSQQEEKVKAATPDPVKVKKLEGVVTKTKAAYDTACEKAGEIDSKVQKLHKQIMAITGGRMKAAQKKVDDVSKNLDKIRQEITRLKVAIKTSQRNAKKSSERTANMEQEIEECEKKMLAMQKELDNIEQKEGKVIVDELKVIAETQMTKEEELATLKEELTVIQKEENKLKAAKLEVDQKIEHVNKDINDVKSKIPALRKQLNNLQLQEIPGEESVGELKQLTKEELVEVDVKDLQYKVSLLEDKLRANKPNISAIKEYRQKETMYLQRVSELEKSTEKRNEMRKNYDMVRKNRFDEFMRGFSTITSKLKEMYQMITLGGDAELELVDSLDPFSEGINFSVRPPKKTWKIISNLSGGEKTLSSLALVFALHYYKPTPLYVMDEIDAALDFKNVSIVGHYIKERTKNAQFIIISLRSNMFELADRLVGIFKTYNCTHSVTVNPKLYGTPGIQATQQPASQVSSQVSHAPAPKPLQPSDNVRRKSRQSTERNELPGTQNSEVSSTPVVSASGDIDG
ncbi:structural maintenance of chromosomes protein 4 [Periplaneta americana]|uniref:structural maintenance of chromosomes protein 4 n=1 Tax=Periplaneta americana TaxID=6978 RepID=UPI0037E855FB